VLCNCTAGGGRSASDVEKAFDGAGVDVRVLPLSSR